MALDFFKFFFVIFAFFRSSRFSACRFKGDDSFLEIGIGELIDGKNGFQILIGLVDNNGPTVSPKTRLFSLFPVHRVTQCAEVDDFTVIGREMTKQGHLGSMLPSGRSRISMAKEKSLAT